MPKRAYYVHEDGVEYGLAVIATSAREAKRIAFPTLKTYDCNWIDMRCQWRRKARDIDDLPIGIMDDEMEALRRGIYDWLEEDTCDICGQDTYVMSADGKAVCLGCMEEIYPDIDIPNKDVI